MPQANVNDSTVIDHLPPQDLSAEISVLGAMLQDNGAVSKAIEMLKPECFYKSDHQKIFNVMIAIFDKGEPIDILTVGAELQRREQLDQIGGNYYLTELVARTPSAANVESHAQIVFDKSVLRRASAAGIIITEAALSNQHAASDVIEIAEREVYSLSTDRRNGFSGISPVLHKTFENLESAHQNRTGIIGVASGFTDLDKITAGFQRSNLIIIAGRPSMGKTAFSLACARNAAIDYGVGVGIFSLEMANYELAHRLLCAEARVDSHSARQGKLPRDQFSKMAVAVSKLHEAPIYIDDSPALSITEIRAKARRLYVEKKVGLFIVDYLQLVRGPRSERKDIEVGAVTQALKALAKELDVAVIVLSQLSRAVEQRGGDRRPILSDLRESGAIEQDADVVLFIYRPEVYEQVEQKGLSEIIIGKQRNGPIGIIKVMFLDQYVLFTNLSQRIDSYHAGSNRFENDSAISKMPNDKEELPF